MLLLDTVDCGGNDTGCSQVIPNYLSIKLPRVILNLDLALCLSPRTIGMIVGTFVAETYLLIFNCHLATKQINTRF